MSIAAVSSAQLSVVSNLTAGRASDGDSKAVEAAESPKTKQAEKNNGGFAPKSAAPAAAATPAPTKPGGVNQLV